MSARLDQAQGVFMDALHAADQHGCDDTAALAFLIGYFFPDSRTTEADEIFKRMRDRRIGAGNA